MSRDDHTDPMVAPSRLTRARVSVSAIFLLYGVILGTWTARIPTVKAHLRLSDGRLSVALLAFAAGAIIGMQVAGRLVDRLGSSTVMTPAVLADGALLVSPGVAGNLIGLAGCLLAFGAVHGTLNVAMNANAVEVQRARGRPMITSCHAVYSIGGFAGAGIGALFASAGVGAAVTFLGVAGLVAVVALAASRGILPSDRSRHRSSARDTAAPGDRVGVEPAGALSGAAPGAAVNRGLTRHVLFLGVLAFCCLVGEGSAADWSSVYLRDSLHSAVGLAPTAYAAFSIAMMSGRLVGDRLAARFGPVALVRGCGLLAAVGLAAGLLVNRPIAGIAGFACLGAGLSCIAPQVFAAAAEHDPARAGQAIGRAAGLGFLGFVVGPVVIGTAAQVAGLPRALAIPAVLAFAVALAAPALGRRPTNGAPVPAAPVDQLGAAS